MSLAEAATRVTKKRAGGTCTIAKILARLDDSDRTILLGWLAASPDDVPNSFIAEELTKEQHPVAYQTVRRHRNRRVTPGSGCTCP